MQNDLIRGLSPEFRIGKYRHDDREEAPHFIMVKRHLKYRHVLKLSKVNFNHDGESFMSGGTDKQVIIWKTNFARRKGNKENKKATQPKKRESVQKRDIYDRIQNDVTTDVGARLGQPGSPIICPTFTLFTNDFIFSN